MTGPERRQQILRIAADEFASSGLHGGSTDRIAREAGITQAYIFRIFGTKKALFSELVVASFDRVADGMREAAGTATGQQPWPRWGSAITPCSRIEPHSCCSCRGSPRVATKRCATPFERRSAGCGTPS
ncbi:TetR/AcrR family transcriptional regulator [Rhodococcus sp. 06-1474-1B]|uniref:TetR/AcrR family transcriptional regulator n=1 Tax=Rhodococcus sp. 06-1474-1B TaxID=2022499 RepID=UPI0020CE6B8A|nr:TetR/AcrR family transcriptional regulator [Rhodococcus sp. 06-1474-1B]